MAQGLLSNSRVFVRGQRDGKLHIADVDELVRIDREPNVKIDYVVGVFIAMVLVGFSLYTAYLSRGF